MSLYLDSFSGSYEQKVTQLIQRCKQMTVSGEDISDMSLGNRQDAVHYDYTASLTKKRIDATIAFRNAARKELVGVATSTEIDDLFAYSNSMILRGGYTNADIYTSVIIASAIWILDQLNIQGKLEEAYPYLPTLDEEDVLLSVRHPAYDSTLIDSVIKLIFMRNRKSYEPMLMIEDPRVLLSERVESDPRKAYDAVISLIDPKAIQAVKEKFERKVWEFYRLSFSAYVALQKEQDRIEKEIDELQRKTLSSAPIIYGGLNVRAGEDNLTTERLEKLEYQLDRLINSGWLTEMGLSDSREKTVRRFRNILGTDLVDALTCFEVDDPFEAAFALHILLDENSSIPWLYYGSICVTYTFVDQLPFNTPFAEKEAPQLIKNIGNTLYTHRFKGIRWTDATDCNREPIERTYGKNLSQILYHSAHTLYPRVADEMPELDSFFENLALENESEKQLYALLIHLLGSTSKDQESLQAYRLSREIEKMAEENVDEPVDTTDLEEAVTVLQGRVKALSQALYEETCLKKNAISKNNQLASENERLIRELADLRELVFMQQSDEPVETEAKEEIKFPVETSGRIVSFGGHPSWINEMKKLLPNVMFYSPDVVPNKDAIRNADQVWVQTQCISHSAFYRIESALGEKTQMRFFPNQNVRNCAEKIVLSVKNKKSDN